MPLAPTNKRYVTRVYGRRGSGAYRSYYVHRSAIPVGATSHTSTTTVQVGGDGYVFAYGYAPEVKIGLSPSSGSGTVTIQGYSPAISTNVAVGVGTVTISGGQIASIGEQANQQDVRITRILPARVSYGGGAYRQGSYHVVRRYVHLSAEADSAVGVGTITIQGFAPTVSATEGELILPGVGTVTITGYQPGRVLQDLTYTGTWKDILRRYSVGTGAYRRDYYRKERRFVYFRTYPTQNQIEAGLGTVTITGYQVFLEPRSIPVGAGSVQINGLPPSPLLDNSVQTISTVVLEAIKNQQKRRRVAAKYEEAHRPVDVEKVVHQFVVPRPQRIIGVPNGTISVTGYRPTTQKTIQGSAGTVTITGNQVTTQVRTRVGAGSVVIQGAEPALEGDISIQINTSSGTVLITGYLPVVNAGGVVNVGAGAGLVTINGNQATVQDELSVSVGSGTVTIGGATPKISTNIAVGAGSVTITGYSVTPAIELSIIEVQGPANIYVQNLQIGLSIPEIAVAAGSGTTTIEGNKPTVIKTGAWVKEDRKNTTWTKESQSSDNWSKTDTTSTTWTKL